MIGICAPRRLSEARRVLASGEIVDSVPTSGGKEDHVSMGMTSALKLRQVVENAECVLGIELIGGRRDRLPASLAFLRAD